MRNIPTEKQIEVLSLRANGYVNKQIAAILEISTPAVHERLRAACKNLKARNVSNAIAIAVAIGLVRMDIWEEEKQ